MSREHCVNPSFGLGGTEGGSDENFKMHITWQMANGDRHLEFGALTIKSCTAERAPG